MSEQATDRRTSRGRRTRALALVLGSAMLASLAGAAPRSGGEPDTIYYDGKVVTVDRAFTVAQAFAVRGDTFVTVGTDADVRRLAGPRTRLVDLHGATVIPGLTDSHDHLWNSARYLHRGVDTVGVTTFAELRDRLAAAVAKAKPGELVFTTSGWVFQPVPTRAQLDAISATVPIVVIGYRRGDEIFNTAALKRLGIGVADPVWHGSKLPVDASGQATGAAPPYPVNVLMLDAILPPMTPAEEDRTMRLEMARRNALGITNVRDLAVWPAGLRVLQRMRRENKLTLRIGVGVEFPDQANTVRHVAELPRPDYADPWLFLDSVGEEPWAPGTFTPAQFAEFARALNRMGWRPAPHVGQDAGRGISFDATTEATLDGYEAADRDSPIAGKRWYVEHVSFARPEDMARMAKLGLVVSAQDFGYRPTVTTMQPDRTEHQNPIKGFLDHGLVVIGGSDTRGPSAIWVEPNDPLPAFYYYVTRRSKDGVERAPLERIGREAALRIFTSNAAYAVFQEKTRGSIEGGMLADFVVLDQDLLTVPDDRILATRALATFVGGRQVFARPEWTAQAGTRPGPAHTGR